MSNDFVIQIGNPPSNQDSAFEDTSFWKDVLDYIQILRIDKFNNVSNKNSVYT